MGYAVGVLVGSSDGGIVGFLDGLSVLLPTIQGCLDCKAFLKGMFLPKSVGFPVGCPDGLREGCPVGRLDGWLLG